MFKIISKKHLSQGVAQFVVEAAQIAKNAKPGQFVIIRVDDKGERIPLTIAAFDASAGTITIIAQEIGKTTAALSLLEENGSIHDIVGPLGHPTKIEKLGTVCAVVGGVGVAEIIPVAAAFKEAGNKVLGIIGARNRGLLILEDEMKTASDELLVMTDDGSCGKKGFVTDALAELIAKQVHIDAVYAIGPVPMMKAVSALTARHGIRTVVSLNPIMVDGTGMCGACRVSVGEKTKFACVDGPEFDAHQVNWNELTARLNLFKNEENISYDKHKTECKCRKE